MDLVNTGNAASVEIVNCIREAGLRPNERDLTQLVQAVKNLVIEELKDVHLEAYELGEFYYFRSPHLRPGFEEANGQVLSLAQNRYPEAWAYLQTMEGQDLCLTEAEWQAISTAAFASLADGTTVGWNGLGGVPYFVLDPASGSLRLPDLRGMYAEASGFDGLGVGGVHGDGIRDIVGSVRLVQFVGQSETSGVFSLLPVEAVTNVDFQTSGGSNLHQIAFASSRVVPTANKNQPRAWGALACVYLGKPAA